MQARERLNTIVEKHPTDSAAAAAAEARKLLNTLP